MAKKNILSDMRGDLTNLLNQAPKAPVQQVTPIAGQASEPEKRLTFTVSEELFYRVKEAATKKRMTIKDFCTELLENVTR